MKHTAILLLLALSCMQANSQFKSLLNKVKDKVSSKMSGQSGAKDSTQHNSSATAADSSTMAPAAKTSAAEASGVQADATNGNAGTAGKHSAPQPPVFPTTGKKVPVTTASFAVDTDEDWNNLLKNPMVQDFVARLRQRGLTGTDKEVLTKAMSNQDAYSDIQADMQAKYGNTAATFKPAPSLVFAAFLNSYDYVMTPDYIRAEIGKTDPTGQQGGIAGTLVNALAPDRKSVV